MSRFNDFPTILYDQRDLWKKILRYPPFKVYEIFWCPHGVLSVFQPFYGIFHQQQFQHDWDGHLSSAAWNLFSSFHFVTAGSLSFNLSLATFKGERAEVNISQKNSFERNYKYGVGVNNDKYEIWKFIASIWISDYFRILILSRNLW